MNTKDKEAKKSPPVLWIPGWAIRIYAEVHCPDGNDALQKAILGLMRAGVPGVVGSLSRELCFQESIVESALKLLSVSKYITPGPDGESWVPNDENDSDQQEVERRLGWVFWDPLRKRLLPELLFDDNGQALRQLQTSGPSGSEFASSGFEKPKRNVIRHELMPTIDGRDFTYRRLEGVGSASELIPVSSEYVHRVSFHHGPRAIQWHPLFVPYQLQTNLSSSPSVYCSEPVYTEKIAEMSPYSPFLKGIIQNSLPGAYLPIQEFAEEQQARERMHHGATFLAAYGSSERVIGEAQDEVRRMLGGEIPSGPFGSSELIQAAEEAECDRLISAKLDRSERGLRTPFSAVLQILGKVMADEMEECWKNSPSALRLANRYPELRFASNRDKNEMVKKWCCHVSAFDQNYGLSILEWNVGTPGDHLSKARRGWPLSQLGTVLRSWGAFAVVAENEPDGQFYLDWIRASIREFPDLFDTFERTKEQRNNDKNTISSGLSLPTYRSNIYRIWRALNDGYQQAKSRNQNRI
jgi:hypothetical protein